MKAVDSDTIPASRRFSETLLLILAFACTLLISFVNYRTGPEWAFSAFYIVPIIFVSWKAGIRAGRLISFISAASWLLADLTKLEYYSSFVIPCINETLRLVVFLVIATVISKLKIAIENQKELAGTDPLTQVLNRRAFYHLAELELNSARRYKTPTAFLYLDIDNFKGINDHFGHHVGDRLLRSVAKSIKSNMRAIDVIVRFGGDEFGVLLTATDAASSLQVTEKLNEKLLGVVRSNGWPVTFSIGIASYLFPPDNIDEMIETADAQMYTAKQQGKNRIQQKIITDL